MKKDLHPPYFSQSIVTCACGQSFEVGSTEKKINVEICSACHPFYTGKTKFVDAAGRVDKFRKRLEEVTATPGTSPKAKKRQARKSTTL